MEQLLACSRFEFWSIVMALVPLGPYIFIRHIYEILNLLHFKIQKKIFAFFEFIFVFNIMYVIFGRELCVEKEPVIFAVTVMSILTVFSAWNALSIKQKRWFRGATFLLGAVLSIILAVQLYYDITFYMAIGLLWRKVFVKSFLYFKAKFLFIIAKTIKLTSSFWRASVRFVVTMTWRKASGLFGTFSLQFFWRWIKKILLFLFIYQIAANRMRRLFMNEKMQQLKTVAMSRKETALTWYKGLKFRYKFIFCIGATMSSFFVGESWDFFYPFLPKGIVVKLIGLVKSLGGLITFALKRLGLQGFIDTTTAWVMRKVSTRMSDDLRYKWTLYRKWRLGRMVIMIDRWIMILNRPVRKKARVMRQTAIENHKAIMTRFASVQCALDEKAHFVADVAKNGVTTAVGSVQQFIAKPLRSGEQK
ncbi:MAG: hypothetical protein ABFQ53_02180 [Patescibacteria group bacterium]